MPVQGFRLGDIDRDPEQRLQFLLQGNKVKEAPVGLKVGQEVEVTSLPLLSPHYGTEDTEVTCAVT